MSLHWFRCPAPDCKTEINNRIESGLCYHHEQERNAMSYQSKPEGFQEGLQPATDPNEQAITLCKMQIQACERRIAEIKGNAPETSRCLIGNCSQPAMGGAPFCRVHAPVVVQTAPGEAVQSPTPPGLTKGEATAREDFHDALRALVPDLAARNAAIDRILAPKAPPELKGAREPKPGEIDAYFAEEHAKAAGLDAVAEYLREMAKRETPSNAKWGELGMVSKAHWKIRAQEVIEIASRPSTPVSLVSPAPGLEDFNYRLDLLLDFVDGARKMLRGDKGGPVLTMGNCDAARELIRRMRNAPPAHQPIPPEEDRRAYEAD